MVKASKQKFKSDDNFYIDSELDIPDFDFDGPEVKDDRSPIVKAAEGALRGAAKTIFSPNIIRSTIKKSMPEIYGDALDHVDTAASTVKSLYHSAAAELKPAINDLKQTTRRILPKTEGILPKKIGDKLKEWTKSEPTIDLSQERQRNDSLALELGSIFQAQAEDQDARQTAEVRREQLNQGIEQIRHRGQIGVLEQIRLGISKLTSYQDAVLANYQKKSLELQFRQYFATVDILEHQKETAERTKGQLAGILKNTGLPEFTKIRTAESFKEIARNKFLGDLNQSLFGAEDNYTQKLIANVGKTVRGKISDVIQKVTSGASLLDQISAAGEMAGETPGLDKWGAGGEILGGIGADIGIGKAQDALKKKLQDNPEVLKKAEYLQYLKDNAGQLINDKVNDYSTDWGMFEGLRGIVQESLPQLKGDTKLQTDQLTGLNDPDIFTRATNKSIIEIIPGYLARIHRELRVMNTGDSSIGLVTYDFEGNKFSTSKDIAAKAKAKIGNEGNRKDIQERLDEAVKMVDPDGKFNEAQKAKLREVLLDKSLKKQSTDAKVLTNSSVFSKGLSKEDARAIAGAFRELFRADVDGKRDDSLEAIRNQRQFSEKVNNLTKWMEDPRAKYQAMVNQGQLEQLQEAGIVGKDSSNISLEAVRDLLLHGDTRMPGEALGAEPPLVSPGGNRSRRQQRQIARQNERTRVLQEENRRLQEEQRIANRAKQEQEVRVQPPTPQFQAEPVSQIQKVTAEFDSKPLLEEMTSLKDLLKENSTVTYAKTTAEVLTRIEERLNSGILVFGADLPEKARSLWEKSKNKVRGGVDYIKNKFTGIKDITLGDIAGSAYSAGRGIFRHGSEILGRAGKLASTVATGGLKIAKKVGGAALEKGSDLLNQNFGDVYVGQENEPRLTRAKMLAGEYFDKESGKTLTSLKDLKGAVTDKDGNILLSVEDIPNAYMKGNKIRMLADVLKSVGNTAWSVAAGISRRLGGVYGIALNLGMGALRLGKKLLPPYDVYVKGQEKPVLYAAQMRLGKYFSQKTGNPIKHPRDIDGPVIDNDGNYVVTDEMIETGLVDKDGIAVSNKIGRVFNKVKKVLGFGLSALKGVINNARDFIGALGTGLGDIFSKVFGGIFGIRGEYLNITRSQLDVQQQILKVLLDRLPEKSKKVIGDVDGDGVREGSAQQIMKNMKDKEDEKKQASVKETAEKAGSGGKSLMGAALGGLSSLFGKKKEKKEGEEGDGGTTIIGGLGGLGGAAGTAAETAGKMGPPKPPPTTKMGKIGAFAKNVGGKLWGATKWVGKAALGLAGLGGLGLTGIGSAAASTLGAVGSVAGTVGSAALGIGGTILGGIATLLASPVVLTALGVAAVAGAGYLAYKYLTKARLDTLSTVRYAQYGFAGTDAEHFGPVAELESTLEPLVNIADGKASLDESKLKVKELMKPFKVDPTARVDMRNWTMWFNNRFKPIFFAHVATLKGINPELKIGQVDSKLKPEEKLKYLSATEIPNGPYDYVISPFPDLQTLPITGEGVKSAIEIARAKLEKESKDAKKPDATKVPVAGAAAATAAATAAGASATKPGTTGEKPDMPAGLARDLATGGVVTETEKGVRIDQSTTIPADFIYTGQMGRMDALTSIRYKAYGLTEMDAEKVKNLRYLEMFIATGLKYDKAGAKLNTDVEAILEKVKGMFGISGSRSERGYDWISWFRGRFLPVFLNFATTLEKVTKNKDPIKAESLLKPTEAVSVANIIIGTTAPNKGKNVSIWDVSESPWRDYALNMDSATTEMNLEALTQTAKAVILGEHKSEKIRAELAKNQEEAAKAGTLPQATAPAEAANAPKRSVNAAAVVQGPPGQINSDGSGVRAVGDFTGGAEIKQPGKGTGGDINNIPQAKGAGWEATKDTIIAAAKMAGVDPKLLATIVAIESNFDPNAKPPIDKYTGRRSSGAEGLVQFIPGTWNQQMKAFSGKYGIAPGTPATDARANALLGAEYIKSNLEYLKGKIKRPVTATDVYLAHFLGPAGATQFLNSDPNGIAADAMGKAANANPTIFYKKSGQPRTFAEIYELFNKKVSKRLSESKVPENAFGATPDKEADKATTTASTSGSVPSGDTVTAKAAAKPDTAAVTPTSGAAPAPTTVAKGPDGKPMDPKAPAAPAGQGVAAPAAPTSSGTAKAANALSSAASSFPKASAVAEITPVPVGDVKPPAPVQAGGFGASIQPNQPPVQAPAVVPPRAAMDAVPPGMRTNPNFTGYAPYMTARPADTNAQDSALRQSMATDVGGIGKSMSKLVDLQTQALAQLVRIADATGGMSMSKSSADSAPAPAPSSVVPTPRRENRTAPRPSVSMSPGVDSN